MTLQGRENYAEKINHTFPFTLSQNAEKEGTLNQIESNKFKTEQRIKFIVLVN